MTASVLTSTGTVITVAVMTNPDPSEYGRWLADARTSVGLTQARLADLVGVTVTSIARYEIGLRTPHADTKVRIAQAIQDRQPSSAPEAAAV